MAEKYAANLPRTLLRHRAGSVLRFPTESSTGPRSNCGRDFNGQQDGQAGGQWHIYGTQEWKKLFTSVSQRQRTEHESADRQHSERVSAVLLIRRSSVRARRGPLVFVQVTGLQTSANDPEPSLITSEWHILCHMARGQAVCSF